jgi:hypothetical protein
VKPDQAIACVFLNIGGVPFTDGWDHHTRKRRNISAKRFGETFQGGVGRNGESA